MKKSSKIFLNRTSAGLEITKKIAKFITDNSVIIAIPRGGVVVGYEIARSFSLSLNIVISRKLGSPFNKELAIGAISENRNIILDNKIIDINKIYEDYISNIIRSENIELKRRIKKYRNNKKLKIQGMDVILVDDGIATGFTVLAALKFIKTLKPKLVIVSAPVCAEDIIKKINKYADHILCLNISKEMRSISQYYRDFKQVNDSEVIQILNSF